MKRGTFILLAAVAVWLAFSAFLLWRGRDESCRVDPRSHQPLCETVK